MLPLRVCTGRAARVLNTALCDPGGFTGRLARELAALQSAASSGHNEVLSALGQRLGEARLEEHAETASPETAAQRCFCAMQACQS